MIEYILAAVTLRGAWPPGVRERLRRSDRPDRIFEVALAAARNAGLIGRRRVLDSTPLYDAVATMDTITLIRTTIRGVLTAAGTELGVGVRSVLAGSGSGDDYTSTAKPVIDWDDTPAREALIDSRARDGHALLDALDGREDLPEPVQQAMRLLATVLGQDLETGPDGTLRIARKVAADRVISTVDPEARHGHKNQPPRLRRLQRPHRRRPRQRNRHRDRGHRRQHRRRRTRRRPHHRPHRRP